MKNYVDINITAQNQDTKNRLDDALKLSKEKNNSLEGLFKS